MKKCKKCKEIKDLSEFCKNMAFKDNLHNVCRACKSNIDSVYYNGNKEKILFNVKRYREDHKEDILLSQKKYRMKHEDAIKEHKKKYWKTDMGKIVRERAKKRWRKENPLKNFAHNAVGRAIKSGKITRKPCEVCGSTYKIEAHHEDYSKPLEVVWLCRTDHKKWHNKNETICC